MLEGTYLGQLFTVQQELEGRFFRYIAGVLAKRLRSREKVRSNVFPIYLSIYLSVVLAK